LIVIFVSPIIYLRLLIDPRSYS